MSDELDKAEQERLQQAINESGFPLQLGLASLANTRAWRVNSGVIGSLLLILIYESTRCGLVRVLSWLYYGVGALRNMVHAAAEKTSTLATMTGDALINTP